MTVGELIEKLKAFPPNYPVVYSDEDLIVDYAEGGFGEVLAVTVVEKHGFNLFSSDTVVVLSKDVALPDVGSAGL